MTMKYVFWTVLAIMVAGLVLGTYFLVKGARPPIVVENRTERVTQPTVTTVIRERMPAVVETLWVNREAHEVATWAAMVDTNRVSVDIALRYDEKTNIFDLIRLRAVGLEDSVYVQKPVRVEVPRPRRWLGFTGAVGVGFGADPQAGKPTLQTAVLDAGIVILERYRVTGWADTNLTYGIRMGVDF